MLRSCIRKLAEGRGVHRFIHGLAAGRTMPNIFPLLAISLIAAALFASAADATTCSASNPYTFDTTSIANTLTANAGPVMGNFYYLQYCADTNLAPLSSPQFTGNVGIGMTPAKALDVSGQFRASTDMESPSTYTDNIYPFTANTVLIRNNTAGLIAAFLGASGSVGIGTSSPNAVLQVNGTATFGNGGAGAGSVGNIQITGEPSSPISGRLTYGADGTGWQFRIAKNQGGTITDELTIQDNGTVGIGTTSPAVALAVVGDIRTGTSGSNGCLQNFAGTAIAGTCSSDAELKAVGDSVTGVLDGLARLQLVRFHWNAKAAGLYRASQAVANVGFVAQAVEQQFPELVSRDSHGYRQLDYTRLGLYGLEAIKELKALNDKQAGQIASLQEKLEKTDRLEAAVRAQAGAIRALRAEVAVLRRTAKTRMASR